MRQGTIIRSSPHSRAHCAGFAQTFRWLTNIQRHIRRSRPWADHNVPNDTSIKQLLHLLQSDAVVFHHKRRLCIAYVGMGPADV